MQDRLVALVRRRWQVLAVTVLSGLVVAAVAHPDWGVHDYEATHVLYSPAAARSTRSGQPAPLVDPFLLKPGAVATLATSRQAAEAVADKLGFDGSPLALMHALSARADDAAATISLTARFRSRPADAVLLADTTGSVVVRLVDEARAAARQRAIDAARDKATGIQQQLDQLEGRDSATAARRAELTRSLTASSDEADSLAASPATSGVVSIRPAAARKVPSHSLRALPPLIGWLLTLMVLGAFGGGMMFAAELADDRVADHDAAAQATGLPIFGVVPREGDGRAAYQHLLGVLSGRDRPTSSESFMVPKVGGDGRIVLVTSATGDDVRTQTIIDFAQAVAATGRTALIVDCEDDSEATADPGRGLGDIAADGVVPQSLSSLAQNTSMPRVSLVSRGRPDAPAAAFLANHQHLVTTARTLADVVILNAPALLDDEDATRLAALADDTVLVCNATETRRADARRAAAALGAAGAHAGLVVVERPVAALPHLDANAIAQRVRSDPKLRGRLEWVAAGVAMLVLYALLRSFIFESFNIPTASMVPYLEPGDRVLVSKLSYHLHDVHRGDVIVFSPPLAARSLTTHKLIKRVIGLPGDVVESRSGHMVVNGETLAEPYLRRGVVTDSVKRQTVPTGAYWVMGDNRGDSADSRYFGAVRRGSIVGRAFFHLWRWPIGFM